MLKLALLFTLLPLAAWSGDLATTRGQELHLTCLLGENPYFIEVSARHDSIKLSLNNRRDADGRGHSRKFIAEFKQVGINHYEDSAELFFAHPEPKSDIKEVFLTIPHKINRWLGKSAQLGALGTTGGMREVGECYVQFLPFPPSW